MKKKYICAGIFAVAALLLISAVNRMVLFYLPTKFSIVMYAVTCGATAAATVLNNRKLDCVVSALAVITALAVLGGAYYGLGAMILLLTLANVLMFLMFAASVYSRKTKLSYIAGDIALLSFAAKIILTLMGFVISYSVNDLIVTVLVAVALILRGKLYANTEKETAQTKEVKE